MKRYALLTILMVGACSRPAENHAAASPPPTPLAPTIALPAAAPVSKEVPAYVASKEDLASASEAATPAPDVTDEHTFALKKLVKVDPSTYAAITETAYKDESSACHACSGVVSVEYLIKVSNGFIPTTPPVRLDITGGTFGSMPGYKVSERDGEWAVKVEGGAVNQGCESSSSDVYLLKPDGPKQDRSAAKAKIC